MHKTMALMLLLAYGALIAPVSIMGADYGDWEDGWAYFRQTDGTENAAEDSTEPDPINTADECPIGLYHDGSPCLCQDNDIIDDLDEPISCVNPFGDNDAFLDAFRNVYKDDDILNDMFDNDSNSRNGLPTLPFPVTVLDVRYFDGGLGRVISRTTTGYYWELISSTCNDSGTATSKTYALYMYVEVKSYWFMLNGVGTWDFLYSSTTFVTTDTKKRYTVKY